VLTNALFLRAKMPRAWNLRVEMNISAYTAELHPVDNIDG
jgi:hypothetical protein